MWTPLMRFDETAFLRSARSRSAHNRYVACRVNGS